MVAVGDGTIQVIDARAQAWVDTLTSGPDSELFTHDAVGKGPHVANENDNTITVINLEKRARIGDSQAGVEPEGVTIGAGGKTLNQYVGNDQHGAFYRHGFAPDGRHVLVDARPRFAEFEHDSSEVWVSSEIGGTVSVIDPMKHAVIGKVTFEILRPHKTIQVGELPWDITIAP